jgi:hypothetical protein
LIDAHGITFALGAALVKNANFEHSYSNTHLVENPHQCHQSYCRNAMPGERSDRSKQEKKIKT